MNIGAAAQFILRLGEAFLEVHHHYGGAFAKADGTRTEGRLGIFISHLACSLIGASSLAKLKGRRYPRLG